MTRRTIALVVLLIIPGLVVAVASSYFAVQDWLLLIEAHEGFRAQVASEAALREVYIADAVQDMHRINLFADVVWALQGVILGGLGVCGLCLLPASSARRPSDTAA